MLLPDLKKLYEPYSKDADLETSLLYWKKEAENLGISLEVRDAAITETFIEMANGKTFPIGTCDCGCEFSVEWSSVAINHYVLKKMTVMRDKTNNQIAMAIQRNIHAGMLAIIKNKNDKFVKDQKKKRMLKFWAGLTTIDHSPL
ncbi:hypothetical protein KAU19_08415 [Candidatus Parcubacteria bacterium]|nr:hypothetical protein [Candidatus Parcubacteria bacterium]